MWSAGATGPSGSFSERKQSHCRAKGGRTETRPRGPSVRGWDTRHQPGVMWASVRCRVAAGVTDPGSEGVREARPRTATGKMKCSVSNGADGLETVQSVYDGLRGCAEEKEASVLQGEGN